jgi:hypothetical protein
VSDDVVFQTLKTRYPEAYHAFGRERKVEVLERYARSPYIEGQRRTYPNNPDKDSYLRSLERLRHVMILFKLGYGSREMAMLMGFPALYSPSIRCSTFHASWQCSSLSPQSPKSCGSGYLAG